jgi:hypothetical protein
MVRSLVCFFLSSGWQSVYVLALWLSVFRVHFLLCPSLIYCFPASLFRMAFWISVSNFLLYALASSIFSLSSFHFSAISFDWFGVILGLFLVASLNGCLFCVKSDFRFFIAEFHLAVQEHACIQGVVDPAFTQHSVHFLVQDWPAIHWLWCHAGPCSSLAQGSPICWTAWGAQKEGQFLEVLLNHFVAMFLWVLAGKHSPSCFLCLAELTFEQGMDAIPMLMGFDFCKLSSFLSCQFLCS